MAATAVAVWWCLVAVTWSSALGQDTSQICPSRQYQLRESAGTSYCYLFVQSPLSYAAANRSCIRDGAIMLNILSAAEDMYVRENFFLASGNQEFWIGLNDIIQEGKFRWENTSVDSVLSSPDYSNWTENYALDNRESRDCVKFSNNGWRVHDLPCGSSLLPFVCKSNTCSSQDREQCLDAVTTPPPQPLVSTGGISAIVIVLLVVVAALVIVTLMLCLWKFKNDLFNRLCCFCCGGGDRSKVRNLQQENQRLRQQLSQHRLSVSGRMPPGQFANALSGVPDGRGGVLPAIKQPISPTNPYADDRVPFLGSPVGGGPPPLSIQRQTVPRQLPGPFIGGRPSVTAPSGAGGLPTGMFSGTTPVRPIRQSLPIFGGSPPKPMTVLGASGERKPVTTTTLTEEEEEEEESESSGESDQEEEGGGAGKKGGGEGAEPKPAAEGEDKQEESGSNSQLQE